MRKEMPNLSGVSGQLRYLFKNPLGGSNRLILLLLSNHIINVLNGFLYEQARHLEYSRENCTQALF